MERKRTVVGWALKSCQGVEGEQAPPLASRGDLRPLSGEGGRHQGWPRPIFIPWPEKSLHTLEDVFYKLYRRLRICEKTETITHARD